MKQLYPYLKKYRKQFITGPGAKFFETVLELIIPLLMASLIDDGINQGNLSHVYQMSFYMVIMVTVGLASSIWGQYEASYAAWGFAAALRDALYQKITQLSFKDIDQQGSSTLLNRMTNDVNQIQSAINIFIRLSARAPFLLIGGLIMIFSINFSLALIFLPFIPVILVVIYLIIHYTVPLYTQVSKRLDRLSQIVKENIVGIKVIRSYDKTKAETQRFLSDTDLWNKQAKKAGKVSSLMSPLSFIIINTATLVIVYFGSYYVDGGQLTQGELIAFMSYINLISIAVMAASNTMVIFNKAFASVRRVNTILTAKPAIISGNKVGTDSDPLIVFKDVSFRYFPNTKDVISHCNLTINRGDTVGVIGGTGAGKSTLIHLLPRYYEVSSGSILYKGVDIKDYDLKQLRQEIAVVLQTAHLFSGTIKSNITWGNPSANNDLIEQAAVISQSEAFIKATKKGYDSPVAQRGRNLSGGQRQRLSIARALAYNPEVIILDDSASALDYLTDRRLQDALKQLLLTKIIVSQRVSAVKTADYIVVLDHGAVVGIGSHSDLLATCQVYQEICVSQNITEVDYGK